MEKILDSLAYIHNCISEQKGFLHLDVQPCNIFIENCNLQRMDFGSAKYIDFQGAMETDNTGCATKNYSGISFTDGYSAPELLDEDIDQLSYSTDVFSVAAIFYRMLSGKEFQNSEDIEDLELSNVPSIIEYRIKSVLRCSLEADMQYRYSSVFDFIEEVRRIKDCFASYENNNYYNLLYAAYCNWIPKQKILASSMEWDKKTFHLSCERLERDLLQNSIDVRRCEYIFSGLWKLKEHYYSTIEISDLSSLLSSGISIYNRLGNNTKSLQLYEELEKYKNEIPVLEYIKIMNRVAVIYSDHYDYQLAYNLVKENIENLEPLKKVYEMIAEKKLLATEKVSLIADLARSYSALGCYMAQLHIGNPMDYFLKAIKEFGSQTGNIAITKSHILHYAIEMGGTEGKKLYEEFATDYFGNNTTLESRYAYAKSLISNQTSSLPFPMWIYLKGLLAFYKENITDIFVEELKKDFYSGVFNSATTHPMPLIYRYIGLIAYSANNDSMDELAQDAFRISLNCDKAAIIDDKVPLKIVMVINYVTLFTLNNITGNQEENAKLIEQLIGHAEKSGWNKLAETVKDSSSMERILEFEYC